MIPIGPILATGGYCARLFFLGPSGILLMSLSASKSALRIVSKLLKGMKTSLKRLSHSYEIVRPRTRKRKGVLSNEEYCAIQVCGKLKGRTKLQQWKGETPKMWFGWVGTMHKNGKVGVALAVSYLIQLYHDDIITVWLGALFKQVQLAPVLSRDFIRMKATNRTFWFA